MSWRSLSTFALSGIVALVAPAISAEADPAWPQWRGPYRDGQAAGFEVPPTWPKELRKVWRVELGQGHSGPVAAGDRAYLLVRDEAGEAVEARRLDDGSVVWRKSYPTSYRVTPEARWHGRGPFSTPLLAEGVLYTFGVAEVLTAWRAAAGELLWRRDFGDEFDKPFAYYGTSLSPLLAGGKLIVHAGGPDHGALVALDPKSGEDVWRLEGDGPPYGSAIEAELHGVDQLVTFTRNRLVGVETATGKLLWSLPYKVAWDNTVQTPIVVDGRIVMAALEIPTRGYDLLRADDGWRVETAWESPRSAIAYTSPVLIDGRLWGFSTHDGGSLYRLDPATGAIDWRGAARQGDHASLVAAGNQLLVFTEAGGLQVLDATAEEPRVLAEYEVTTSAQWAHPAVFGRNILVRGQGELILWEVPAGE